LRSRAQLSANRVKRAFDEAWKDADTAVTIEAL
jgi:hypothetical protein